jgi:hypothetical protein
MPALAYLPRLLLPSWRLFAGDGGSRLRLEARWGADADELEQARWHRVDRAGPERRWRQLWVNPQENLRLARLELLGRLLADPGLTSPSEGPSRGESPHQRGHLEASTDLKLLRHWCESFFQNETPASERLGVGEQPWLQAQITLRGGVVFRSPCWQLGLNRQEASTNPTSPGRSHPRSQARDRASD